MSYDDIWVERVWEKLEEILAKLDAVLSTRRQQVDPALVIERYNALGNMALVAGEMGISTQRVSQIINKHRESADGIVGKLRIATSRLTPRVEWKCQGCGLVVLKTRGAFEKSGDLCVKCKKAARGPSVPDELMEKIVADLKIPSYGKLAKWGKEIGYKNNPTLSMAKAVLGFLTRHSRLNDIEEIWPDGVPKYLVGNAVKRGHVQVAGQSELIDSPTPLVALSIDDRC